jgi:hypothetical protein
MEGPATGETDMTVPSSRIIAYAAMIAVPSTDIAEILPLLRHLDDDDFDAVMACATEMVRANDVAEVLRS